MLCALFSCLFQTATAQDVRVVKGDCTPDPTGDAAVTRGTRRQLPAIRKNWDANKIYYQMVILVEFSDSTFSREDAHRDYDRIFNEPGYNERLGVGCVADYFRDQSNGLFNIKFDVYGPIKVSSKAQPYSSPTEKTRNYGRDQFVEATKRVIANNPDVDYSKYDWDGDGSIEQVIFVYASLCGNQGSEVCYGFIWPNTSSFSTVTTPTGLKITNYTSSGELWMGKSKISCGIGTICHEFTHSLGLPDIYPTSTSAGYSVVDEWDLMDGGNFTNYGWCPPNLTAQEKMLLGWVTPVELTEPISITDLKPSAEGGEIYRVSHSDSEWLLLENRQQRGWDLGIPGKGLVIYHVNYDRSVWSGNTVNINKTKRRFELVNADNLDYDSWDKLARERNINYVVKSERLNRIYLSTSPFPWSTDSTSFVNRCLTDSSVPPARMNYPNLEGSTLLGKPITNIRMSEDGLISFDFMKPEAVDVAVRAISRPVRRQYYDLSGRPIQSPAPGALYIVRDEEGKISKYVNRK